MVRKEDLWEKLREEGLKDTEISERLQRKLDEVGGLLSVEGALLIIASELGIDFPLTIRCSKCGEENPSDSKYCSNCGTILRVARPGDALETSPPRENRIHIKRPLGITIAVILLGVYGFTGIIAGLPLVSLWIIELILAITLQFLIINVVAHLLYGTFSLLTAIVGISVIFGLFMRKKWTYRACLMAGLLITFQGVFLAIGYHAYYQGLAIILLAVLFLYYLYRSYIRAYFRELLGPSALEVNPLKSAAFFMKYYLLINGVLIAMAIGIIFLYR